MEALFTSLDDSKLIQARHEDQALTIV